MSSDLVLLQPEDQPWWRGGEIPFRVEQIGGKREVMVNVTAMLAGVRKSWSDYQRLKGSQDLIAHAESVLQICRTELVQTIQGGDPRLQGTWAIKTIALDAAAWASTPLRWWMLETALAKLEGRDSTPAPGSPSAVIMLRAMADAIEQQDQKIEAHGQQLSFLAAEVQGVKAEVQKTDLDRVCERRGIPHPSLWADATQAIAGAVIYLIRDPKTHRAFYLGESGSAESRLVKNRGRHEAFNFMGMKGLRYETVCLPAPADKQDRTNLERELTAAMKPDWQYQIQQEEKRWAQQFKTGTQPLHNLTGALLKL